MKVEQSAPADFDLYRIYRGSEVIATIYAGLSPQRSGLGVPNKVIRSGHGELEMHLEKLGSVRRINIFISRAEGEVEIVHIASTISEPSRKGLMDLLSSIRPCKPIEGGGQHCLMNDVWSKDIVNFINDD